MVIFNFLTVFVQIIHLKNNAVEDWWIRNYPQNEKANERTDLQQRVQGPLSEFIHLTDTYWAFAMCVVLVWVLQSPVGAHNVKNPLFKTEILLTYNIVLVLDI